MEGLTKKEFKTQAMNEGFYDEDYTIASKELTLFPFFDREEPDEVYRSAALVINFKHVMKEEHSHVVVIAYMKKKFFIWCGDAFVAGGKTRTKKAALDAVSKITKNAAEKVQVMKFYASQKSAPCNFWANGNICKHTKNAYSIIESDPQVLDDLIALLDGKATSVVNRSPEQILEKYSFKKHILLQGDKGSGKTTLAMNYANDIGAKVFYSAGHEKSEASDFIGEFIPYTVEVEVNKKSLFSEKVSQLSMIWKDGPLAAAIRYANTGKKAVFVYDEVLRTPREELSPLISALAPHPDGTYKLNTRRAVDVSSDNLALEEVLSCPKGNLWIIGTTNIGSAYAVDKMDEAFADRVRIVQMDTNITLMESVLKKSVRKRKFAVSVVEKLMQFYSVYEHRRIDGAFKKIVNLRHLDEAVNCAIDEDDIKESLWETRMAWVDTDLDGKPREEQLKELTKILNKIF